MLDWLKSHLIEDWHQGWKWFSVQAQAVAGIFVGIWLFKPELMEDLAGQWASKIIVLCLIVLGLGGRFVLQGFTRKAE